MVPEHYKKMIMRSKILSTEFKFTQSNLKSGYLKYGQHQKHSVSRIHYIIL